MFSPCGRGFFWGLTQYLNWLQCQELKWTVGVNACLDRIGLPDLLVVEVLAPQ